MDERSRQTRQRIRDDAEAIYGMKYGVGGFYQFEPLDTQLLDSVSLTMAYQDSEVVGINESTLVENGALFTVSSSAGAVITPDPDSVFAQDNFPFEKLTTGEGDWVDAWENSGEPFEEWMTAEAPAIPEVYSLEQNWPNPFNPVTTLRFGLQQAGQVELVIFNLLGQKVTTLINGWRPAGWHEVTWDAQSLPSGLYFCKIKAGEFTQVKKMVMVK